MSGTMVQSHNSLIEMSSLFDDAVTDIRNRGYTRESALTQAADFFGMTVARAKKLLYGEVAKVSDEERRAIRRRYAEHLQREAEHYQQRLERAHARHRQLVIDL